MSKLILPQILISVLMSFAFAAAATAAPESGKTFRAHDVEIYYEVRGGGPGLPLVVVNGGPGFDHTYLHCSSAWDTLALGRPVVFYDQRGNGRSGAVDPGQSCTLPDQIEDLEALREHLGYPRIDLLGHSWGGYLVMAYAARHPDRIAHLMMVDSAAPRWSDTVFLFDEVYPETVERQQAVAFAEALGDEAANKANLHEYLSMLFYSLDHRDAFLAGADSYQYDKGINEMLNQDLARYDLNPELAKLRMPTMVIIGRFDMNVAPSVGWKIHKAIPGSEFAVFEESGHLPFFEEPEAFVSRVESFLTAR